MSSPMIPPGGPGMGPPPSAPPLPAHGGEGEGTSAEYLSVEGSTSPVHQRVSLLTPKASSEDPLSKLETVLTDRVTAY